MKYLKVKDIHVEVKKKLSDPKESYCINTTESVSTQSILQDAYSLFYKIKTFEKLFSGSMHSLFVWGPEFNP